jgi:hypothetical protein
MDCIPNGIALDLTRSNTLSEAYQNVLRGTTNGVKLAIATRARTPEEEAAYQKACQFLYLVGSDGFRSDSPSTIAYKQYQGAVVAAEAAYKNKLNEATFTSDPAAKNHWETIEEPSLRGRIAELESEWAIKGYRAEHENARRVYEQYLGISPSTIWEDWSKQCISGIDKLTDAVSGEEFFPCGFSPSNILDLPTWTSLTLSEHEVEGLAQAAPPEIRTLLGTDQMDLDIESLSLEVSSASIRRAWFSSEVFRARFWKFYDTGKMLSTGQAPPSGDCPAYVAAVVFARNLAIKLRPQSPRNQQALTALKGASALSFATFRLAASQATPPPGQTIMLKSVTPAPAPIMIRKSTVAPMTIGSARKTPLGSAQLAKVRVDTEPDQLPPGVAMRSGVALRRMQEGGFKALPVDDITPPPPPAPQVQMPFEKDEVWILGVICRYLQLCPDPDPTLRWE